MIKLPFFKKPKCSHLYNNFVSLSAGNNVSKLTWGKKLQNFPEVTTHPRAPNCTWNKPNLFAKALLCSDSSQYTVFSQLLINAVFLNSGIGPDILVNVRKDCIVFHLRGVWILFNFYLQQKQVFSLKLD